MVEGQPRSPARAMASRFISRADAARWRIAGADHRRSCRPAGPERSSSGWIPPAVAPRSKTMAGRCRRSRGPSSSRGARVVVPEVFLTGEGTGSRTPVKDEEKYAGYYYGYNRSALANRVHDVLTAIAFAGSAGARELHVIGTGAAGVWTLTAKALAGPAVKHAAIDLVGFDFDQIARVDDDRVLPGALKYGGVLGIASLCTDGSTSSSVPLRLRRRRGLHDRRRSRASPAPRRPTRWRRPYRVGEIVNAVGCYFRAAPQMRNSTRPLPYNAPVRSRRVPLRRRPAGCLLPRAVAGPVLHGLALVRGGRLSARLLPGAHDQERARRRRLWRWDSPFLFVNFRLAFRTLTRREIVVVTPDGPRVVVGRSHTADAVRRARGGGRTGCCSPSMPDRTGRTGCFFAMPCRSERSIPILGRDVAFYVFELPFLQWLQSLALLLLALTTSASASSISSAGRLGLAFTQGVLRQAAGARPPLGARPRSG